MPTVWIRAGRERSIQQHHPWVFSGSIDRVDGDPDFGALVMLRDSEGGFLAWGHYSPHSQIRVRLASWVETDDVESRAFWEQRVLDALAWRSLALGDSETTSYRVVNAESDGIPGLIVDRYGPTAVVQFLAAGVESRREVLADVLWNVLQPESLYERSDADIRQKEGLGARRGLIRGSEPPERVLVLENGLRFHVDVIGGQKTGAYLDQRDNRQQVREWMHLLCRSGAPAEMLNVFSYTAGFAVYGLAGGVASVTNVDSSRSALALGRENVTLNGFDMLRVEDMPADAFTAMRSLVQQKRSFDAIVLDPPKLAASQREIDQAVRAYKDINLQAFRLLRPQGLLFTFSCSGGVSAELFQKVVFGAAEDAHRAIQIVGSLRQASDHPIALTFPEGAYLKGLICRALC